MELLNYGLKELDLASYRLKSPNSYLALYRLKSPNSYKEHPSVEVLKTLCVTVPVIFWSVIIICSYDWWTSNKLIHLIQNPEMVSHITRICDTIYVNSINDDEDNSNNIAQCFCLYNSELLVVGLYHPQCLWVSSK
jgi:hypothetical protein